MRALLHRFTWLLAMVAALQLGCAYKIRRTLKAPEEASTLDGKSRYLKVHMRDGGLYVLLNWNVDEATRTVVGLGDQYDADRNVLRSGRFTLSIADVALFETNVEKTSGSVAAMAVMTVLSAAVTVACLTNPKACFGSCPTFYVTDGDKEVLQAEGFSASIAPSLEASDVDALYLARPDTRRVELRVTNEALETHVIRHAELLAVERPLGGRVFATPGGELWRAVDIRPPHACAAEEGDCLAPVKAFDRSERYSATDGVDLAARETLELSFDARDPGQPLGLVLGARQTFLSTFLFYQALAYMGREATAQLAKLERGDPALRDKIKGIHSILGGIEIQVPAAGGGWRTIGEVDETGPIATDVQLVELPAGTDVRRVRLRMTRGHWRLGYVAVARLDGRARATRLQPVSVRSKDGNDDEARDALLDPDRALTTLPGDAYTLVYELPGDPASTELFLDSRGYYLEWMREEWMKEESRVGAAMMLYTPGLALRFLAPKFKKMEPEMERLFWSSRYAAE
jgi:hypothetical protein